MFTTYIVKPLFNLLVGIYALIPGHNFGLAIIVFTILVRLLMWPLVKKQLNQAKKMRELQPELKKIKKQTKGNKQKESQLLMELYKEKGINPVGSIVVLIPQFIILIGLYDALRQVSTNTHSVLSLSYGFIHHLPWMQTLSRNIHLFDDTFLGFINLSRSAAGGKGGIYLPALIVVLGSAVAQYFQTKQLMPTQKDSKSLRAILKDASKGSNADQSEVNASVAKSTRYLLPVFLVIVTIDLPAALSFYWLTSGVVAYIQQSIVLKEDEQELETVADLPNFKQVDKIPEAEIVETEASEQPLDNIDNKNNSKPKPSTKKHKAKKRRKK